MKLSIKKNLLILIKNQGDCMDTVIDCDNCIIHKQGCHDDSIVYQKALTMYIEKYGKANLVEELI